MGAPPGRWSDFRTTLRDGRAIETSWANVPLPVGGNLAIGMDVTEPRRAEQALRQAEERYRMFITQSTEGIWRFEPDEPIPVTLPADQQVERCFAASRLAECNDAIAQMYGYASASELVGVPLGDLLARTEPRNVELLHAFVQSGYRLADVESHEVDLNGRPKTFLNNLVGLVEDGRLVRVWGTQRDVTEARQLEEQLRRAQKMEAVGRLAGGIAHDFNNILTAILGTTQLLDRELAPDAAARPDIGEIRKAAERAADLTRQLLAYSRQQVLAPRVLDVHAAVRGLGPMLRRLIGEDVELVTEADSAPARAKADPGQLEQVIVNLVVNARDAMPRGGRLTITTGSVELDGAAAVGTPPPPPGRYVRVAVIDTGTGMTDEVRAHLFEPFFTTKDVGKGTGLGLATVYGIVKQSGGFIYVDSEVGRGTAIRMYLPAVDAPVSRPTPAPPTARIARASETLLLVEDEEAVRTLARRALEAQGYQVLAAASGPEALALAERHAGPIHALVTDVVMPGMSGPEVARRLSATRPAMQVLYTSGYTADATVHHGLEEGAAAFLQKPFEPDSLTAKVRQVLDRPA
ncbi:MAG: hypothetical protein AUI33_05755 [Ignavibacteria bacterium 13_1_40CM_2_61_4]|nr:MAG: hypothetical protein AUI33_05755 [Ignavibacteria bacterium 13_1_40CM_2_61_4]